MTTTRVYLRQSPCMTASAQASCLPLTRSFCGKTHENKTKFLALAQQFFRVCFCSCALFELPKRLLERFTNFCSVGCVREDGHMIPAAEIGIPFGQNDFRSSCHHGDHRSFRKT